MPVVSCSRIVTCLLALSLPLLVPGLAVAGGPTPSSGVLLRYVFSPGEARRYAYSMEMEMQIPNAPVPVRADIQMEAVLRTERVLPDGSAVLATTVERLDMFLMGDRAPLPDMAGFTTRQRVYRDGRITETEVDRAFLERLGQPAGAGGQLPFGGQGVLTQNLAGTSTQLPDRPMRVGEFVEREQQVDLSTLALAGGIAGGGFSGAPLTARSRLTLEELTTVGGRRVARLTEAISATLSSQTQGDFSFGLSMSGRVSNVLDVATAWPVMGEGTIDATYNLTAPGRGGQVETVPLQMTMRLSYRQA